MQFSMSLAVFAVAVSALPQPISVRKEPRIMSPQEAAHEALKAAGLRRKLIEIDIVLPLLTNSYSRGRVLHQRGG